MSLRLSMSIVGEAEAEAVRRVITEDGYLGIGKETHQFEKEVAAYLGVAEKNVVSANTGTAALTLAVDALRPADWKHAGKPRVLVPSLTFLAPFQAILAAGCEPVACAVLPETGTLDKHTWRHLAGQYRLMVGDGTGSFPVRRTQRTTAERR